MSGDIYNVKNAGAVGAAAQNIVSPSTPPPPPKPPKRTAWKALAGGVVVVGLAVSAYFWISPTVSGPAAISTADTTLPNADPVSAGAAFDVSAKSAAGPRLALVIAQTNYSGRLSDVTLAENEAGLIASALKSTGFDVTRVANQTRQELAESLDAFRGSLERAGPDAVGFVYYTGHGAQHPDTKHSYLLGTDARLNTASDLAVYGLDMKTQRDGFAATGARVVFLVFDACRNDVSPGGWKANVKGIGRVEAAPDMLIAYSTRPDDVAEEGIYAPILAEELVRPGQTAETAFTTAQRRVASKTNRGQVPFTDPDLINEFCFVSCPSNGDQTAAPSFVLSDEILTTGERTDRSENALTDEQDLLFQKGSDAAEAAMPYAQEAKRAEDQARTAAYRVKNGGPGCSDALYFGECDDLNGIRHGVETYGGASTGEVFAGRLALGNRAIGRFQYPDKPENPAAVSDYWGQFAVDSSNARGTWNGYGALMYKDGSVYLGQFRSGQRHGYGLCGVPDGIQVFARWQNDVRTKTYAENEFGEAVEPSMVLCGDS